MTADTRNSFTHIDIPQTSNHEGFRSELRAAIGLTGCEISVNSLTAGTAIPFVHKHRENEEAYLILSGKGEFWLDGAIKKIKQGDAIRIAPTTERCMRATGPENLVYLCVQAREGSTPNVTRTDGIITESKPTWG